MKSTDDQQNVGIISTGIYIPSARMSAAQIADATDGKWDEKAIVQKLGIVEKAIPGPGDGTQEMGALAAIDCLRNSGMKPSEIDLILCIGEEWKEYPLTTSGIYIQQRLGADNAWAIDLQQRCCSAVAAMKIAKDMMLSDPEIKTVMIAGGYRNGDFIDYTDSSISFMYNLGAGGGAILLKRDHGKNLLFGTHIITDGTMARDAGVEYGGTEKPINAENVHLAYKSLRLFDEKHMKSRLNLVSMNNWMTCIEKAFIKSGISRDRLGYLAALHFKRSMYQSFVTELGLSADQSIYLEHYGHLGQIDPILSLHLAVQQKLVAEGTVVSMVAAGIGYAWGANVIRWGG